MSSKWLQEEFIFAEPAAANSRSRMQHYKKYADMLNCIYHFTWYWTALAASIWLWLQKSPDWRSALVFLYKGGMPNIAVWPPWDHFGQMSDSRLKPPACMPSPNHSPIHFFLFLFACLQWKSPPNHKFNSETAELLRNAGDLVAFPILRRASHRSGCHRFVKDAQVWEELLFFEPMGWSV